MHAIGNGAGRDCVAVEQDRRARAHQLQVPIHRVLIQRHEHVELVAVTQDRLVTRAEGQEDVTAANDGLVGIVGVDVEPAPDEDPRQNVAGSGNPLARRAANADGEVDSLHGSSPVRALKSIQRRSPPCDSCGERQGSHRETSAGTRKRDHREGKRRQPAAAIPRWTHAILRRPMAAVKAPPFGPAPGPSRERVISRPPLLSSPSPGLHCDLKSLVFGRRRHCRGARTVSTFWVGPKQVQSEAPSPLHFRVRFGLTIPNLPLGSGARRPCRVGTM